MDTADTREIKFCLLNISACDGGCNKRECIFYFLCVNKEVMNVRRRKRYLVICVLKVSCARKKRSSVMDAHAEPDGPRKAPTASESEERREAATAGVAAVATSVAAPCLRAVEEDVSVLRNGGGGGGGGGGRTAAVRLLVTLPAIPEEEGDRLSIEISEGSIDDETEACLLGEPPHAGSVAVDAMETVEAQSEAMANKHSEKVAGQEVEVVNQPQSRSSDRPEPLSREETLEVTDPDPRPPMIPGVVGIEGGLPAAAPMDWDAEPVSSGNCSVASGIRQ